MSKLIRISRKEVREEKISHLSSFIKDFSDEVYLWNLNSGETEYKLYSYLSSKFNDSVILDIGTRNGNSALALSKNTSNNVISYDIVELESQSKLIKDNIEFRVMDFTKDKTLDFDNIPMIMIDVDPHDGSQERMMFEYLKSIGWSGLILLDDTRQDLWPQIYNFIQELPYKIHDVTDIGHFSGTAIVEFGSKYKIEMVD